MTHIEVRSSNLKSIAHDGATTMHVRFKCSTCSGSGETKSATALEPETGEREPCGKCGGKGYSTFAYDGVPQGTYDKVRKADSVGSAFHKIIKANIEGRRVEDA